MNFTAIVVTLFTIEVFVEAINPIIIIPGMGGNHMEAKLDDDANICQICKTRRDDYFTIWPSAGYIFTRSPLCIFNVLKLTYDNISRTTSNVYGVHTRIPGFGGTETFEYADTYQLIWPYFRAFVKRMTEEGYVRGVSIRGAPFDFRKGPTELSEYFNNVKTLIEETYAINDNQPIILLGHSYGGLLALELLNRQTQEWKDKYVKLLIGLAPSWGGCVKALEAYVRGVTLRGTEFTPKLIDFPTLPTKYTLLPSVKVLPRKITRRLPALMWQFPWPQVWHTSEILVRMNGKSYTIDNMEELFRDLGDPDGWEMYKDIYPFMKNLQEPGVKLLCIYGTGIRTVESVDYSGTFLDIFTRPVNGDGDGIVNIRSFEVCKQWKNTTIKPIWGVNHVGIVSNSRVIEYVVSQIYNI